MTKAPSRDQQAPKQRKACSADYVKCCSRAKRNPKWGTKNKFSVACQMAHEFSQRAAQRQHFSEILSTEIRPGGGRARAFPADLHHANDSSFAQNGGADDFLDGFA